MTDPVIRSAVRNAARGGAITEDLVSEITVLRLSGMPESWEELEKLPALTTVTLPQQALLEEGTLPDGDITVELTGGGA